jgi:PAS domain S-box-containing protein
MHPLGSERIAGLGFEQMVRYAPVAISVVDASGRVIDTNERARELTARLGREVPADLDGAIEIFHSDGRRYERHEWPAVRSITSGEEIVEEEFFYALPDGGRLAIRCSSSPVREKDGEIVAAVLAMADVTEHKRQEQRLTYLAGLLDNTEDAIVAMDERYVLTVWNKGAERLYGWRAEEVVGRHANDVARTNLSEEQRTELRRELTANGRWRGEVTVARKDGTTVEAELISVALRGEQRDITGYLTIHRDISERKRAEQALRLALHLRQRPRAASPGSVARPGADTQGHPREERLAALPRRGRHGARASPPRRDGRARPSRVRAVLRSDRRVGRGARLSLGLRLVGLLPQHQRAPARR